MVGNELRDKPFFFNEQFQFEEFFYYLSCFCTLKGVFHFKQGNNNIAEKFLLKGARITEKYSYSIVYYLNSEFQLHKTKV